jgi:NADPH-dependent ferric siderophore reductase
MVAGWLVSGALAAAELRVGDAFPYLSLPDQHGQAYALPSDTARVLFAADKLGSDLLNGFLAQQPDDYLGRRHVVYIADISSMPAIVTRLFALPKMRERPYRIMLADEAAAVAFLPRQAGAVTVVHLRERQVVSIGFLSTEAELGDSF